MSKPKHYRRGKGFYVGYGISSTKLKAIKGALSYPENMRHEILALIGKFPRDVRHILKLQKYLSRCQ